VRAVVVVLGDLGRSSRMLAHVWSLLGAGHEVHLVGGGRTPLPPALRGVPRLHLHALDGGDAGRGGGLRATLATGVRGVRLGWQLAKTLFRGTPPPDLMLVQTPPPIPTLPIAILAARLRGARLIVDWHNLGWTLLALRFGPRHPLVWVTRHAEFAFGRLVVGHLAVSAALARRLAAQGMGEVAVLHDSPSSVRPFPPARTDLPDDPLVVVAPMGWTRDDDLPLLGEALRVLTRQLGHGPGRRRGLRILVSGNGPQRSDWGPRLRALGGDWLQVETPDVPTEDYPELLASAHLGLSIHRSSSGVDLPMKIVELQAVGVPILTIEDGSPLDEIALVGSGVLRYQSAEQLAGHLLTMLREEGAGTGLLAQLTAEVRGRPRASWDAEWTRVMAPLLPPGS